MHKQTSSYSVIRTITSLIKADGISVGVKQTYKMFSFHKLIKSILISLHIDFLTYLFV